MLAIWRAGPAATFSDSFIDDEGLDSRQREAITDNSQQRRKLQIFRAHTALRNVLDADIV